MRCSSAALQNMEMQDRDVVVTLPSVPHIGKPKAEIVDMEGLTSSTQTLQHLTP